MKIVASILLFNILGALAFGGEFPICQLPLSQTKPAVAYDHNEKTYTIVYPSGGSYWGDRIMATTTDESGNIIREFVIAQGQPGALGMPSICFNGVDFLVTWTNMLDYNIWGVMVHLGQVGTPFTIVHSIWFPGVNLSASAWNSQRFLVVWEETNWSQWTRLSGCLLDNNGNPIGDIFEIFFHSCPLHWYCHMCIPDVVSDGLAFLVAFNHYDDDQPGTMSNGWVYYRRVIDQYNMGSVVELESRLNVPFNISNLWFAPSVTFDGANFFCTYHFLEEAIFEEIYNIYGAIIDRNGNLISNNIPIAVESGVNELCSATSTEDKNIFVVWQEKQAGFYNVFGGHYDQSGALISDKMSITVANDNQINPDIAFDGINNLVVWQDYRDGVQWDIWGNFMPKIGFGTDDPLALANNGNRHLVRQSNTENLHLVYTDRGKIIYRFSNDGGATWTWLESISEGKFPTITLGPSPDYLPSVAWTDDIGGIYYRRQTAPGIWGSIYHLWDPWSLGQPALNSAPSIAIVPSVQGDSVHILVTLYVSTNGPANWVADYAFRIDDPMAGLFTYLEGGSGYPQAGAIRYNPSIVRDNQNALHAVWQRADTICYGVKAPNQTWDNWGWQFLVDGIKSAHPFVETYGDMVYVVWQRKETPVTPEEVYRAERQVIGTFDWEPFSLTPNTRSLYPVNATGLFTVFADSPEPPINGFEIYYKTIASEPWTNISQTSTNSNYPQSAARYFAGQARLYTAWLDGDHVPYGIYFKSLSYILMEMPAYYTSINGHETPSPYLVDRDSFISEWQIPVDIGNETITYRFLCDPGYKYRLRAIAYHEQTGEWREWIKLDNKLKHQIKYDAYEPETLAMWIPPGYYRDSVIDIVFERKKGDFATAGMIQIYQYEYDEGECELSSGPMVQEHQSIDKISFAAVPNPFSTTLHLELQVSKEVSIGVNIYDITGRLVKDLYIGAVIGDCVLQWNGDDLSGRKAAQGIYFIRIDNLDTGESSVNKIVKMR